MPLIPIAMALAQFVPNIVKLLTGSDKAEDVASQVVGIAQTITGASDGEAALAAIKADPNKVLEFQQTMSAQQADLEKAYLLDVQSARQMQIAALAQDDLFSKRFVYYFAIFWSVFAMAFFTAVTFLPIQGFGQRIADTILGVLVSTIITGIFHYMYGSTRGSAAKTEMIARK